MKKEISVINYTVKNSKMLNDYLNRRDLVKYRVRYNNLFKTVSLVDFDKSESGNKTESLRAVDIIVDNALKTYIYKNSIQSDNGIYKVEEAEDGILLSRSSVENEDYFVLINGSLMILFNSIEFKAFNNPLLLEVSSLSVTRKDYQLLTWNIARGSDKVDIKLYLKYSTNYIYINKKYLSGLRGIRQLFIDSQIVINDGVLQKNIILIFKNQITITVIKNKYSEFQLDLSDLLEFHYDFDKISYRIDLSMSSDVKLDFLKIPSFTISEFKDAIMRWEMKISDIVMWNRTVESKSLVSTFSRFISILHNRYHDSINHKDSFSSKYLRGGFHLLCKKNNGTTAVDDNLIDKEHQKISSITITNRHNIDYLKIYMNYFYGYGKEMSVFNTGINHDDVTNIKLSNSVFDEHDGKALTLQVHDVNDNYNRVKYYMSLNLSTISGKVGITFRDYENQPFFIMFYFSQKGSDLVLDSGIQVIPPGSPSVSIFLSEVEKGAIIGRVDYLSSSIVLFKYDIEKFFSVYDNEELTGSEIPKSNIYYVSASNMEVDNIPVDSGQNQYRSVGTIPTIRDYGYDFNLGFQSTESLIIDLKDFLDQSKTLSDSSPYIFLEESGYERNLVLFLARINSNNFQVKVVIQNKVLEYVKDGVYKLRSETYLGGVSIGYNSDEWIRQVDSGSSDYFYIVDVFYIVNEAKYYLKFRETRLVGGLRLINYSVFYPLVVDPKVLPNIDENNVIIPNVNTGKDQFYSHAKTINNNGFYSIGGARYGSRHVTKYSVENIVFSEKIYFQKSAIIPVKIIIIEYPDWLVNKRYRLKLFHGFSKDNISVKEKDNSFTLNIRASSIIQGENDWVEIFIYYDYLLTDDKSSFTSLGDIEFNVIE